MAGVSVVAGRVTAEAARPGHIAAAAVCDLRSEVPARCSLPWTHKVDGPARSAGGFEHAMAYIAIGSAETVSGRAWMALI